MKVNLPVTQTEQFFPTTEILVSETDINGVIRSANAAFCKVAGFTEQELVGQNHHVVRHPDMPPEAFKDLWRTVKAGQQWEGIVKNRCANGDFYWVKARVTPVYENGKHIGYRSVRKRPSREEVAQAEKLYQRLKAGEKIQLNTIAQRRKSAGFLGRLPFAMRFWIPALVSVLGAGLVMLAEQYGLQQLQVLIMVTVLLNLAITYWISYQTKQQFTQINQGLKSFDAGDVSARIDYHGDDELGQIAKLFNFGADMVETSLGDIAQTVAAVAIGDFDRKVVASMNSDFLAVKNAVNSSVTSVRSTMEIINSATGALRSGNFNSDVANKQVALTLQGEFHSAIEQAFAALENMESVVNDVVVSIRYIQKGDFTKRISLTDREGFYRDIGKGINNIVDIFDAWLKEITRVFSGIEVGDLTQKIYDDGSDAGSFTDLTRHTNAAIDNLQSLVMTIRIASDSINTAAREMAEGNINLSQRTEQQASSLEETASSMEQLAATVKTNADNAKQADRMASAASDVAIKGGFVFRNVVETMDSINHSSNKIVDIIGVIDSIAFQTNILALNAAVEAARAGEQGRGFAVVASEVRTLAQKSAGAAKEIKQLISDSVSKVEEGSTLVKEAGVTMDEIVTSVKRVTDIMNEISAASSEQSSGIAQVNQAIIQMDDVTQQNAALVEESAAAATSLEEQAQGLIEAVSVFKISTATPSPTALNKRQNQRTTIRHKSTKAENNDWVEF